MNKTFLLTVMIMILQCANLLAQSVNYYDYSNVKSSFDCSIPLEKVYDSLTGSKEGLENIIGVLSYNPSLMELTIEYEGYEKAIKLLNPPIKN